MGHSRRRKTLTVGKDLKQNIHLLKMLHEARGDTKRRVLQCCSRDMCNALSEIASNMLKGNIPLTERQYNELRPHAADIERLSKKKTALTTKRQILQKGGFIGAILGPALSLLAPAVGSLVSAITGKR